MPRTIDTAGDLAPDISTFALAFRAENKKPKTAALSKCRCDRTARAARVPG